VAAIRVRLRVIANVTRPEIGERCALDRKRRVNELDKKARSRVFAGIYRPFQTI